MRACVEKVDVLGWNKSLATIYAGTMDVMADAMETAATMVNATVGVFGKIM